MNQTSRQEGGHICEPEASIFFLPLLLHNSISKYVLDQVMEFLDAKQEHFSIKCCIAEMKICFFDKL
jgi:hypothetical protein